MAKKTKKTKGPAAAKAAAPVTAAPVPAAATKAAAPTAAATKVAAAPVAVPSTAAISARAHQIWIARGKPTPGTPLADWVQAERELGVRKS